MKLKIAIFHLGFFYSGGGEKLVIEEMRGLRALGHEVTCFAPYVDRDGCYPDLPEMTEIRQLLPGPPRWLPMKDPLWIMLSCLLIPFMAPSFRRFDALMGANQPGPWLAFVLSKLLRKPYVIYLAQPLRILHPRAVDLENGIRIREGDARFLSVLVKVAGKLIDLLDHASVRGASIVFCNGTHVSRWIRDVYGVATVDCPAGCHPLPLPQQDSYDRLSGKLEINGVVVSRPFMLISNRHSPMKRFEYGLWALKRIKHRVPDFSLVITGQETSYTSQLRYLAESLGLKERVTFVGLVSEQDLLTLYRTATLYLYPSPEEDFGMGIVEAMAAATPVVAWKNGGPTVTVRDGETGYLVDPYDTEELAERIVELATNPQLAAKLGHAGAQRARECFSYDRHTKTIEKGIKRILEGRDHRHASSILWRNSSRPQSREEFLRRGYVSRETSFGDQSLPVRALVAETVRSSSAVSSTYAEDEPLIEDGTELQARE